MWKPEVEELKRRKDLARQLGGKENVAKHHKSGRMTVRERIDALVDKDSFVERGILAGVPTYDTEERNRLIDIIPCPFVMGVARVDGRRVAVHGDDFTVKGASVGRMYKAKSAYFVKVARSLRLPIIRLIEGAGGSIKEILEIGYTELPTSGDECTQDRVEAMSEVPVVSVGFGSIAGLGAMYMVQSHFSVMIKKQTQVFVGGPPLVKAAFGQKIDKEELGGHKLHARETGVVDNEAEDEIDALGQARTFLSYLPSNVWEMPHRQPEEAEHPGRQAEELLSIIPRDLKKPYDIRRILEHVFDRGSLFEIGRFQMTEAIIPLKEAVERDLALPVVVNHCEYIAPARFGDRLVLTTTHRVEPKWEGRFVFNHTISNEKTKVEHCRGYSEVTVVETKLMRVLKEVPKDIWVRYQALK